MSSNPADSEAAQSANLDLERARRAAIASALKNVRHRNRIAVAGLAASLALACAGVGFLWWWKARASDDPIALRLRSPIEFRNPIEFVKRGAHPSGAGPDAGASGPVKGSAGEAPADVAK